MAALPDWHGSWAIHLSRFHEGPVRIAGTDRRCLARVNYGRRLWTVYTLVDILPHGFSEKFFLGVHAQVILRHEFRQGFPKTWFTYEKDNASSATGNHLRP